MEIDDLETPGGRLRWARSRRYADALSFSAAMQINEKTYRAYENNQNGYSRRATDFARKLGVTSDWLLHGVGEPDGEARPTTVDKAPDRPLIITTSTTDGAVEIRQLDLSYSMGPGATPEDFPEETPVLFDPNFLRTITRAPTHRLYVARGDGDSMFPTLINDDQVLVDTTQNTIGQQDRIWALSYDGAHMIKRLRRAGKGRIKIISDNTTVPIDEVDEADLRIFGRVIWVGRRV